MKFIYPLLLAFATLAPLSYAASAEISQSCDEQSREAQLKMISTLGKKALHEDSEVLSDLATRNILPSDLLEKIRGVIGEETSLDALKAMEIIYERQFSNSHIMAASICAALEGTSYHPSLSSEERPFFQFGLSLSYLASGDPLNSSLPLLRTGLKSILDYYTGSGFKTFSISSDADVEAVKSTEEDGLPVLERAKRIVNAAKLSYQFLIGTPLTESLRFWDDVAKASGWCALHEFGTERYRQKEVALFRDPMEQRFQKMIAQAQELKTTIDYTQIDSQKGTNYAAIPSLEEKYEMFFLEELSNYVNACLRGSYYLNRDRSMDEGIETARATKAMAYKKMADLAVALYPGKSGSEMIQIIQGMQQQDWAFREMKTLFHSNTTPNLENGLWGELILGYEKLSLLRASVQA